MRARSAAHMIGLMELLVGLQWTITSQALAQAPAESPARSLGTLMGRVRVDSGGRFLPEVEVLLDNSALRATTDANGRYVLAGIPIQLARELYFTANKMKAGEHRLVLINPGEKISSLILLIAPDAKIASFPTIEELPSDPRSLEQQIERLEVEFEEIRKNLFTNPLWQFVDRETCWLCPFCANAVEEVKIVSRVSIPRQTLDNLYRHLHRRCIGFNPKMPRFKPQAELDTKIKKINAEKFSASKSLATALESKVKVLEDIQSEHSESTTVMRNPEISKPVAITVTRISSLITGLITVPNFFARPVPIGSLSSSANGPTGRHSAPPPRRHSAASRSEDESVESPAATPATG